MPQRYDLTEQDRVNSAAAAIYGLRQAVARMDRPHVDAVARTCTFIEAAWWICAANEAMGWIDSDLIKGFRWVRNKGIHNTILTLNAAHWIDITRPPTEPVGRWSENAYIWQRIAHATPGQPEDQEIDYRALIGKDIPSTIRDSLDILAEAHTAQTERYHQ